MQLLSDIPDKVLYQRTDKTRHKVAAKIHLNVNS